MLPEFIKRLESSDPRLANLVSEYTKKYPNEHPLTILQRAQFQCYNDTIVHTYSDSHKLLNY